MNGQIKYEGSSHSTNSLRGSVAYTSLPRATTISTSRLTESELVTDIRRVARLLHHSPSSVEYSRCGRYHVRTLQRRFDTSWKEIIEAAGLRYTSRTSRRIPTTDELRADVHRVAREVGHPPTRFEYCLRGKFGSETVRRRSRMKKWEDAVEWLTGVNSEEVKLHQRKGGRYRTTGEWLARLRELSGKLGHAPTTREANHAGINAHELCRRVGGNWVNVLERADIDLRSRSKHARLRSTGTEELIEDVVRISRRLGRPAKAREYEELGSYSHLAVRGRVGGWKEVKRVVVERLAGDTVRTNSLKW